MANRSASEHRLIRLYIVEDHQATLLGLKRIISNAPWIQLMGESGNGLEALTSIPKSNADVVLLDLSLPGLSGVALGEQLIQSFPKIKVTWFSAYPPAHYAALARTIGVKGYLHKSCAPEDLLAAVELVSEGKEALPAPPQGGDEQPLPEYGNAVFLPKREREVLALIGKGLSAKEISAVLSISPRTIETYRDRICKRLHLRGRSDLIRCAVINGLV
jgi:DNA-binding NarL/FixJ family response regulator